MNKKIIITIIVLVLLIGLAITGAIYYDNNYVQTMNSNLLGENECCSCNSNNGIGLDVCCSCKETNFFLKIFKGWKLIITK